jgi:hypothetical protein
MRAPGSRYRKAMRERRQLVISRQTGDATLATEVIGDDADLAQRIAELKASVPDIGPVEARFLATRCDGCGTTAELDFDNPRLPDSWAAADNGDFFPRCQALN